MYRVKCSVEHIPWTVDRIGVPCTEHRVLEACIVCREPTTTRHLPLSKHPVPPRVTHKKYQYRVPTPSTCLSTAWRGPTTTHDLPLGKHPVPPHVTHEKYEYRVPTPSTCLSTAWRGPTTSITYHSASIPCHHASRIKHASPVYGHPQLV